MKIRALTLTSAFLVAVAAPALAQTGATARVAAPGDGAVVVGNVTVSGSGSAAAGVRSIKLSIEGSLVDSKEPSDVRQNIEVSYGWATGGLRNGWYQVRVEVTAVGGATDTANHNVKVDNAPQTPANFSGSVREETVSLTWSPNPEPDITGYRLEVATGDSWSVVTETQGTSYAAVVAPGTYQYRVTALRSSPTMRDGRPSDPSSPIAVIVEAPRETDSNGGTYGGRNLGRGAVGGGDPRVYGRDGAASTKDVKQTARAFSSGGLSFGGLSLPGQTGLPSLPSSSEPFEWGTYKERLPYSIPEGGVPLESVPPRLAALSTTTIIPMDALRWVGAGTLMIVIAILLQFFGWRANTIARLGAEGAAALKLAVPKIAIPKVSVPAVSFKDANVRLRRVQDRVRATWTKARGN